MQLLSLVFIWLLLLTGLLAGDLENGPGLHPQACLAGSDCELEDYVAVHLEISEFCLAPLLPTLYAPRAVSKWSSKVYPVREQFL